MAPPALTMPTTMLMLYPLSTRNRISALTSSGTSGGATGTGLSTTGRGVSVAASSPQATAPNTANSETNAAAKAQSPAIQGECRSGVFSLSIYRAKLTRILSSGGRLGGPMLPPATGCDAVADRSPRVAPNSGQPGRVATPPAPTTRVGVQTFSGNNPWPTWHRAGFQTRPYRCSLMFVVGGVPRRVHLLESERLPARHFD